ncbi:MAG: hypothetical protein KAS05_04080, partial [Candidatus Omnitrophica bacterium]|nr:hypothetical protein [Candidatus Omnitrophota bacterium]
MRKSQAILEVTVIFIVGLFLFFGIMGMWMWGDNQIAKRQPEYNQTRVAAGTVKLSLGSIEASILLASLIAQRDDLEAQLDSLLVSMENSMVMLEASKLPHMAERDKYKTEKALLDAEKTILEAEQVGLEAELAELLRTCRMRYGRDSDESCVKRIAAIRSRLGEIATRTAEIDDRVNNFLIPKINFYQEIIDQIDSQIAILGNDVEPGADLEAQINELNELIADLESEEKSDPEAKDLYWPVYEPDELTEEDVFG